MLTCDLCGEHLLLEEDMKTHLLLSHLEAGARCPLCSLSGVTYDQLRRHVGAAHPEHPAGPSAGEAARATWTTTSSRSPKTRRAEDPDGVGDEDPDGVGDEDPDGVGDERGADKQTRLSPPGGGEARWACPLCSVVCGDASSLQEHVELHLDHEAAAAASAGSPGSDLKLARRLQEEQEQEEEEEQQRRLQEARREREEFKKLQAQFGLDGRGGYSRQMERSLEGAVARGLLAPHEFHCRRAEMREALASGLDDGTTRTPGVVGALYEYYQTTCSDRVHVWLSADADHYCSSAGDRGWGCGYRNLQMLLSSLLATEAYAPLLQEGAVPSIPRVQSMIEEAWRAGLDPQGASHFNQRLQGTRAWIGATEIYSLLTSLGIGARIIDFHKPTGPGDTHPRLFEWVKQYFLSGGGGSRLPPRLVRTGLPPLYLQHQGHSRSIVGLEQKRNGTLALLLLDPDTSAADVRKLLSGDTVSAAARHVRRFPGSLKHQQYQVVAVHGVMTAEERRVSAVNSRTLCAERIP
ncbi:zinc finger-containing ubiquitin peptidase 1 [Pseudoliparis swirei]|uniref:zinc finger-containing ubiquitin peptidase 1 n=1 Tax=Pseudoliparis swirei TaxID=2059687 RepID=UPI0024BF036A|nr:zinc finger-containing ubiquitin peptidase 1 [Pseudoliparis swirei]XP_056290303.1 zinc finger-containing ubiquitin peptidase 1 [Pseudoliparis swirei]XP_056290304.1 zinc finger-containing ubiquitin peptidase 1 [Pseudoliparis swirei]